MTPWTGWSVNSKFGGVGGVASHVSRDANIAHGQCFCYWCKRTCDQYVDKIGITRSRWRCHPGSLSAQAPCLAHSIVSTQKSFTHENVLDLRQLPVLADCVGVLLFPSFSVSPIHLYLSENVAWSLCSISKGWISYFKFWSSHFHQW